MGLFLDLNFIILTALTRVIFLYYGKEKTYAKITPQIYQKRKSPNSPGGFRYKRAGEIDFRVV